MFVGSERGNIFQYNNVSNNLNGNFNLVDSFYHEINNGPNASIAVSDLNNDTLLDAIIGNKRGGLSLYLGTSDSLSNLINNIVINNEIKLYPNPASEFINLNIQDLTYYEIFSITGEKVMSLYARNRINVNDLEKGIYLIKFNRFSKFIP